MSFTLIALLHLHPGRRVNSSGSRAPQVASWRATAGRSSGASSLQATAPGGARNPAARRSARGEVSRRRFVRPLPRRRRARGTRRSASRRDPRDCVWQGVEGRRSPAIRRRTRDWSRIFVAATVTSIWRYPVKSMLGEEIEAAELDGQAGVLGDRTFALIDGADGKVATAKNPRKWPNLFAFSSRLRRAADGSLALEITLDDGTTIDGAARDLDTRLSAAVGRPVTLAATKHAIVLRERSARPAGWNAKSENYTPEIEDIGYRERLSDFPLREGTFFDAGLLHLVSTQTLERFGRLDPASRFDFRRFRPNLLIDTGTGPTSTSAPGSDTRSRSATRCGSRSPRPQPAAS